MNSYRKELWFNTTQRRELINITPDVKRELKNSGIKEGLILVNDFIDNIKDIREGMDPFPISLRGMNWIKFLFARFVCVVVLEKSMRLESMKKDSSTYRSIYSWCWIILPDWRYYLRKKHVDRHKRFGRYDNHKWNPKPNRVQLWKLNGYKYKLNIKPSL